MRRRILSSTFARRYAAPSAGVDTKLPPQERKFPSLAGSDQALNS